MIGSGKPNDCSCKVSPKIDDSFNFNCNGWSDSESTSV